MNGLTRRRRMALFSAAGAAVVLGVVVAANVVARFAPIRLDISDGRVYSLSPASKQVLKRLEDPLLVTAYFSPDLPPQYAATRDYLENLLKEYRAYARGMLRYEFVRAEDTEKFREAALREGIPAIRFNILEKESYQVREAFLGLTLKHLDKKEILPFVQDAGGLEYDITAHIKKMMREKKKAVGFVASNGAMGLEDLPRAVRAKLEESYEVRPVELEESTGALDGLEAVLLLGPVQRLSDRAVYALDQFLLSGKSVGLALDVKRVDMRNFLASPLDLGLDGWLKHLGLELRKNLVLDFQAQKVSLAAQQGFATITTIVDYPPFVVATDLSQEHPATKGLDSLALPYVAPVEVSTTAAGRMSSALVKTSRASWTKSDWDRQFATLNPFDTMRPAPQDAKGPFNVAVVTEGVFDSYFPEPPAAKKEEPKEKKEAKKDAPKKVEAVPAQAMLNRSLAPGRLILVGTSRFLHPDFPMPDTNYVFFLNMVDWLAQDPELIAIRSKATAFRPLRELSPEWKTGVRYAAFFGGPFLVIGLGVLRWRRLTAHRAARVAMYRP